MMEAVKRLLIADTDEAYRRCLREIFEKRRDFVVVGDTGDGGELVRMAREEQADAIVMDVVLAGMDGLAALEELQKMEKRPRILMLSGYTKGGVAELAAERGADYFILACTELPILADALGHPGPFIDPTLELAKGAVAFARGLEG